MSSAQCVAAVINGVNSMRTSWRSVDPKGIEDYLKDFCKVYRGEDDNPHDVNATNDDERAIQFFRYHLWDIAVMLIGLLNHKNPTKNVSKN